MTPPLVTCIMPTRDRRRFVGQAIAYFLRQDYPSKELIVVDDGGDPIADLVPEDERIRYVRLDERRSLGAKRNLGCELARGSLIAHWDDDDWFAPDRISRQVAGLSRAGALACGTRELLHYHVEAGQAWLYSATDDGRPWLHGGTLLYRRSAWTGNPFPEVDVGEDAAFVQQLAPDRVLALPDASFYLALIHGANTARKRLSDPHWERRTLDEVGLRLSFDRDFYTDLRNGGRAAGSRPPSSAAITLAAPFLVYDGYGSMAEYLALGMARAGATVNIVPLGIDRTGLSEGLKALLDRSRAQPGAPVLYFNWPKADLDRFRSAPDLFLNTMWESSRLPAGWPEVLSSARAVIVPTRFVADVCRASGVTAPVEVVPEGIDPDVYRYEERPERAGLTTLMVGTAIARKHTREGIAAWKLASDGDPDARLIVKSRFQYGNYAPDDPRIRFVDANEPTRGIAHWYREADVLLALGNEGFGLPLVEGMATGLPVIALDSEGQGDVCADARDLVLPVSPARWDRYDEPPFGPSGVRGVPAVEDVAASLRWVATHRGEAREIGRSASAWAREHRNIWRKGPAVLEVMERRVRPPRPLRRNYTFWTPSWGSRCGIAEYTAHLLEALPSVHVEPGPPDARRLRVLHIQHESSLFAELELTHHVQKVRHAHVPVAVTEHSVTGAARPWEPEADVLVATTQRGAGLLHARWGSKRIEHIPIGCPTWFPPRKRERGRVIGSFGFLEAHKGFGALLETLRRVPGSELLLFSYSKSAENDALWRDASEGLPVRRVAQFVPAAEAARRLAAEADVLAFWYDETQPASASAAVRVGLATGVPVLTSPTRWFDDVSDVTYQPRHLVEGVERLLHDTLLRDRLTAAARDFCHDNSWPRIAERHLELWRTMEPA